MIVLGVLFLVAFGLAAELMEHAGDYCGRD